MRRPAARLCWIAVAGLLAAAACTGKGTLSGGGGGAGAGDRGGAGGTLPISRCPATPPKEGDPCDWLTCSYSDGCLCPGCCGTIYRCLNGQAKGTEVIDTCAFTCGNAGTGWDGSAGGNGGTGGVGGQATGGAGGSGGAPAPLTSCPAETPKPATSCTGSFTCDYDIGCRCGGCCVYTFACANDQLGYVRHTDDCMRACDGGPD